MARSRSQFVCQQCQASFSKWAGRCENCGAWNSLVEQVAATPGNSAVARGGARGRALKTVTLDQATAAAESARLSTGIADLDEVLGGGLLPGGVVLMAGQPGIGKSTLLAQVSGFVARQHRVLYVSGEESISQVKMRVMRLGSADSTDLQLAASSSAEDIAASVQAGHYDLVVVDSVQTLSLADISSAPGSVSQITNASNVIIRAAKAAHTATVLVGHVTKEGSIAGPKVLEHLVDVVLQFEGDRYGGFRVVRAQKNRYGSTNEISIFDMKENGISEVKNPSEFFISDRDEKNIGSIIVPIFEGSRVFLFEVQSLLGTPNFGMPRRTVEGYDKTRVEILSAVLSRSLKVDVNSKDIYINIPGGIDLNDRSSDLAVVFSLLSSVKGVPISQKIAAIGELGLRGEVRKVSFIKNRVNELEKMGFSGVYLPKSHQADFEKEKTKIKLNYISNISELVERVR